MSTPNDSITLRDGPFSGETPSTGQVGPTEGSQRTVRQVVTAHRQLEGAGFVVRRPFPSRPLELLDPFLLLDEMGPVMHGPGEAVGAPDHPHRGFETVTYLLDGEFEHEDSAGNRGRLGPGDVQWMTAGAGVVHSEVPSARLREQGGRLHGFQLWVNLPARDKRMAPRYQEVAAAHIPRAATADGRVSVRVIAGEALGARAVIDTRTPIVLQHWQLQPGGSVVQPVSAQLEASVYVFGGAVEVGPEHRRILDGQLAVLGPGEALSLRVPEGAEGGAELLLLAGQPLREPVARYGPFVMNTEAEIREAIDDFRHGRLGAIQR